MAEHSEKDVTQMTPKELRTGIIELFRKQQVLMNTQVGNIMKALEGFDQQISKLEQENSELRAVLHKLKGEMQ
jgi:regulator of replication initiation timing